MNQPQKPSVFYMLFAEKGTAPTFKHTNYEAALEESKRLSSMLGCPVYILKAVQKVVKEVFTITDLAPTDDLPF